MVGLALGIMLSGCSGGESMMADDVIDPLVDVEEAPKVSVDGTWRVELADKRARRLTIIAAALSSEPLRVQGLGKLEKSEKDLYETWSRKKGADVREMEKKLRMTRSRYVIADQRVTVQVDNDGILESYGPVDYSELESASGTTVLRFDPGMGNGFETHTFVWQGTDQAADRVTANGKALIELPLVRQPAPPPAPEPATPPAD